MKMDVKQVRRLLLTGFGIAATAAAAGTAQASQSLFAGQFLDKGAEMKIPEMVYDPQLQMMVDPATLLPIYQNNNKMHMAKVTAGCGDCPKYDSP